MNGVKACKMDNGTSVPSSPPRRRTDHECSYSTDNVILNEEKTVTATGSTTAFNAGECHTLQNKQPDSRSGQPLSARLPPAISFFKERMASKYIPETAC